MKRGGFFILAIGLVGCSQMRKINGDQPRNSSGTYTIDPGRPDAAAGPGEQAVAIQGKMPDLTLVAVPPFGVRVRVFVRPNGAADWIELMSSDKLPNGAERPCYAFDEAGGIGPIVRFLWIDKLAPPSSTGADGWPYFIWLYQKSEATK